MVSSGHWAFVVVYCIIVLVGLAVIAYGVHAWRQYRKDMLAALYRRRTRDSENSALPHHMDNYWAGAPPPPHAVPLTASQSAKNADYDIPHVVITHL